MRPMSDTKVTVEMERGGVRITKRGLFDSVQQSIWLSANEVGDVLNDLLVLEDAQRDQS